MARGKKKSTAPRDPAPVSGPGALSRRTDSPPVYASPQGERPYGERKAVEQQAQAAPMYRSVEEGVFGPTERPEQPPTAGAPFGPGRTPSNPVPDDPNVMLRAIYEVYPHPDIYRLLTSG